MPQLLGPAVYVSGFGALVLVCVALHWCRAKMFAGSDVTALVMWGAPSSPPPSSSGSAPTLWSTVCAHRRKLLARLLFLCFCVTLVWSFVPYYAWQCAGTATLLLVELTFLAQLHAEARRNRRRRQCAPEMALQKREAESKVLPCNCDYSPSRFNRRSREWKQLTEATGGLINKGVQKQIVGEILNGAADALVQAGSKLPVVGPLVALAGKAGMGWLITKCMGGLFAVDPPPPDPVLEALGRIEHQIDALHGKVDEILANLADTRLHDDYLRAVAAMEPVVRRLSAIRDQWEVIVSAPLTSRERSTRAIIDWRDAVLHPRDGLLALLKTYAYGSATVLAATGALYGTARQHGVYQAWQDTIDSENRDKWTLRTQAAQTACKTPEADRLNVWRTPGSGGKVHANMLRDQADVDAVWQQGVQWLQVQTLCMQMILEASHVPDAFTPEGAQTTAETLQETTRAASKIETDLKFISDHMDRQRVLYMPLLPLGIDTFQYVVQGASNLVFALWDRDERPNTAADGVDERDWRLATKAEITFLLLQMGAPAPYDTTIDSWRKTDYNRAPDQTFLMMGPNGPERLVDIRDYAGVTTNDTRLKQWYDEDAANARTYWNDENWKRDLFWPRIDVTKSVWYKVGRFGDATGTTPLSFCVGHNLEDTDTVYRADLNWFVPRGSTVVPPVDHNQPRYELRVRTYDTTASYRPPTLARVTDVRLSNSMAVRAANEDALWYLEGGQRRYILNARVFQDIGSPRTETLSQTDLDALEIGPPLYLDSYYDTRRFISDLPSNAARPKEGEVVGVAGDGIWKILGGRRHWLSTVDAYNDLKQGYASPPSLNNRALLRDIPIGYAMKYRPLPAAAVGHVKTGDVVRCRSEQYYIQGGTKHYMSGITAAKMGFPNPRLISCDILDDLIPTGDPV